MEIKPSFSFTTTIDKDLLRIIKSIEPKYKITIQFKYLSFNGDKSKIKYFRWREKIKDKRFSRPVFIMHDKIEMIVKKSNIKINKI